MRRQIAPPVRDPQALLSAETEATQAIQGQFKMFGQSFHKKWGVPQSEGAKFLIQATEKLIWEEGRDWDDVKFIAQKIMNDMWMSNRNQKKTLTIVRRGWNRHHSMIRAGLVQGAGLLEHTDTGHH